MRYRLSPPTDARASKPRRILLHDFGFIAAIARNTERVATDRQSISSFTLLEAEYQPLFSFPYAAFFVTLFSRLPIAASRYYG